MDERLASIVKDLRAEESRWDAILELKLLQSKKYVDPLIRLLSDKDWVIRWCIAEKLGEMSEQIGRAHV